MKSLRIKRKKLKSHDIEIKDYHTHITIVKVFHFSATLPSKTFIYSYSASKIPFKFLPICVSEYLIAGYNS